MQFDTAAAATGYVWTATDADGNGDWAAASGGGGGDVSKVGTPASNQVAIWTGNGTLEGESEFTFSNSRCYIQTDFARLGVKNGAGTKYAELKSHVPQLSLVDGSNYVQYFYNSIATGAGQDFKIQASGSGATYTYFASDGSVGVAAGNSLDARLHVKGSGTGSGTSSLKTTDSGGTTTFEVKDDGSAESNGINVLSESLIIAASDETTALTTGTGKITFRMPYALTLTEVRASLTTAGGTSGTTTIDINESGTTILSTKLTIDNTEKTSTTAATAAVISDSALADDAEITIDIDAISGGATEAGLKIYLIGNKA